MQHRFLSVYPLFGAGTLGRMGTQAASPSADFQLRLPCEPPSVPRARARVREWCRDTGIRGDHIADVQLAVTEAAANAVRHSGCIDFEIRGSVSEEGLVVCVWDQGQAREEHEASTGLGTQIIRALAESVDFEDTRPGTRVTMRFPGTPG